MTTLLQQAIELAKAKKRPEAEALLRQVLETEPNNEVAWMWLSGVLRDPAAKQAALEQAAKLNPKNQLAHQGIQRFAKKRKRRRKPQPGAADGQKPASSPRQPAPQPNKPAPSSQSGFMAVPPLVGSSPEEAGFALPQSPTSAPSPADETDFGFDFDFDEADEGSSATSEPMADDSGFDFDFGGGGEPAPASPAQADDGGFDFDFGGGGEPAPASPVQADDGGFDFDFGNDDFSFAGEQPSLDFDASIFEDTGPDTAEERSPFSQDFDFGANFDISEAETETADGGFDFSFGDDSSGGFDFGETASPPSSPADDSGFNFSFDEPATPPAAPSPSGGGDFNFDFGEETDGGGDVGAVEASSPASGGDDGGFSFDFGEPESSPFPEPSVPTAEGEGFSFDFGAADPEPEPAAETTADAGFGGFDGFDWGTEPDTTAPAEADSSPADLTNLFSMSSDEFAEEFDLDPEDEVGFEPEEEKSADDDGFSIDSFSADEAKSEPKQELSAAEIQARNIARKKQQERLLYLFAGLFTMFVITVCGLVSYFRATGIYTTFPGMAPASLERQVGDGSIETVDFRGFPADRVELEWQRIDDPDKCEAGVGLSVRYTEDSPPQTYNNNRCQGNTCRASTTFAEPIIVVQAEVRNVCSADAVITVYQNEDPPVEEETQ